jgi:hypothetical protein
MATEIPKNSAVTDVFAQTNTKNISVNFTVLHEADGGVSTGRCCAADGRVYSASEAKHFALHPNIPFEHTLTCGSCSLEVPKSLYSSAQLKKNAQARKCKHCVAFVQPEHFFIGETPVFDGRTNVTSQYNTCPPSSWCRARKETASLRVGVAAVCVHACPALSRTETMEPHGYQWFPAIETSAEREQGIRKCSERFQH